MQNVSPARRGIRGAIGEVALVIALSLALFSFAPALAHADTQNSTIAEQLRSANKQIDAQGFTTAGSNAHNWLENDPTANVRNALFPSSFDLRDNGVVTPVKLQNPWGTCWGFAAIASSETSILSELKNNGQDYSASSPYYDLSERQLAWFAYSPIPDNDPNGQGGEGQVHMNTDPNAPFNTVTQAVCQSLPLPFSLLVLARSMSAPYLTKMMRVSLNTPLSQTKRVAMSLMRMAILSQIWISPFITQLKVPGQ